MKRKFMVGLSLLLVVALCSACASKEEKKLKFFNRGQTFYENGDYVKAELEFKNALQIDPKYADAYYMLGRVGPEEQEYQTGLRPIQQSRGTGSRIDGRAC